MQKDKEALFDSVDTVRAALEVFSAMLPKIEINRGRMEAAAGDPSLLATDLAEYLVKKGTPFREAHDIVGALVARAVEAGVGLNQIRSPTCDPSRPFLISMLRASLMFAVHLRSGARLARPLRKISPRRSRAGINCSTKLAANPAGCCWGQRPLHFPA